MGTNIDEEIRGIRKISTFVTADALLAAVLMVWAQLWIQPSVQLWVKWYGEEEIREVPDIVSNTLQTFECNVGFGLFWTYFSVLLALLALAWTVYRTLKSPSDKVPATAIGLFIASVIMAVIDVAGSILSITLKLLCDCSIWEPLPLSYWLLCVGVAVILGIVAFSMWIAHKNNKN